MRPENPRKRDSRAVSEAISYVLVFGLITVGGTLVVLQGAPAIDSTQDSQIAENSQRAALLLQDRVDEMARQGAQRREFSVSLQDIRVGVGLPEPTRIEINATNSSGDTVEVAKLESDPIYIETTGGDIDQVAAYENGAVLLGQKGVPESWTMRSQPSWAITTNGSTRKVQRLFLRTVSTTGSGSVTGRQSSARVLLEMVSQESETLDNATRINISVRSPRAKAWEEYLSSLDGSLNGTSLSSSGNSVTLSVSGFDGGSGSLNHKTQVIRAEVTTR